MPANRLLLSIYNCRAWQGFDDLPSFFTELADSYNLIPLSHKEVESSGEVGRLPIDGQQLNSHIRENFEKAKEIFQKYPSELEPLGKVFLTFRLGNLSSNEDFIPTKDDFLLDCQATIYQDGFTGLSFTFSLAHAERTAFSRDFLRDEVTSLYVDMVPQLVDRTTPDYLWIGEDDNQFDRPGKLDIQRKAINTIFWGNYFGLPFVKQFGKDFLLNSPGWKKEELDDGGVFLQLGPKFTEAEGGPPKEKVLDYFKDVGVKHVTWPHGG